MPRRDYAKQIMEIPFKQKSKPKCVVCGKTADFNPNIGDPLCRDHTFSRGTVYILDMKSWTWRCEER